MQAEIKIEKVKLFKSHKKYGGGDYWYTKPGSIRYTIADISEAMRAGIEFEFLNGVEEAELLSVLSLGDKGAVSNTPIDRNKKGDVNFLNRIIRNGGFCNYIAELESR